MQHVAQCAALAFSLAVATASAQTYPMKPVRMIFGFGAGGAGDIAARLLSQKLAESLGQPVIVENRTGAGGAIADEAVAKSAPDGHTLLFAAGSSAILPAMRSKLPYDIARDFAPVSLVATSTFLLSVHPLVPVRDAKGLIALARAQPGKLTFGSPGVGHSAHLAGEAFNMMAGIKMLHVPYKSAPEAATAVAGGQIDVAFPSVTTALPLVSTGKLKGLAVSSIKRSPRMPSVPSLDESGLTGYQRLGWNGVLAPAAVPREIVRQLNAAIVKAVHSSELSETLTKSGLDAQTNTPEQFAAFIKNELEQNAKLVKFAGIRPE